ncbi:DNA polymerase III subunit delta' [Leucobacter luti]|uniref:DNA polymerase III delta prime subunit n=1 Tax=Leucobacter luti TaxID=340320 RepID=A0A4Q7TSX9_9MICO|nr:DNA polymerase III subunit delta' [Leucobacter luti]MBL3700022.1 DNA polymerase III subunit delta' [Leucobacter luti]RZT62662.1 DNA polymerase III delta prime subunit [Leucobacter luti]
MDYWAEIVGQADAVRTLHRAAEPGVVAAHAWLITGPPGSGRSNLAFRFAAALIARTPEQREAVFEQVRARTHPDIGVLTTQKLLIDIRAAREIVTTAHYAPAEGRYRVIVIEDADRMPERTSNVLLKALEEPPERTIWILCAPSEADLLPTIRSRARSLRLVTPRPEDIAQLLHERDGIDAAAAERAARLAQSHIGMARRLATDEGAMQRRDRSIDLALSIATLGDAMRVATALVKVAEADASALTEERDQRERDDAMRSLGLAPGAAIPPQMRAQMRTLEEDQKRRATRSLRDGIDRILTDLLSVYRDILLHALTAESGGGIELINREEHARIADLAERWGPTRALAVVSAVEAARVRLTRGITPGLVLEALFAGIIAVEEPA